MSANAPRRFHLINSEDQFQEQLWEKAGEIISGTEAAKLKILFFMSWKNYGAAKVVLPTGKTIDANLDCDSDEADPSCFSIQTVGIEMHALHSLQIATVVITIFRATYRMRAKVIDRDGANLYLDFPDALEVLAARNFPRHNLSDNVRESIGACFWKSESGVIGDLRLISVGLRSVTFECPNTVLEINTLGALKIGAFSTKAKCVKSDGHVHVCELEMADEAYEEYFQIYSKASFEKLDLRKSFKTEAVFELFKKSGYFGQFGETDSFKEEIIATWDDLSNSSTFENVDYVSHDSGLNPIGASSLTKAFVHGKTNYWAFHQLCALRREEEIQTTGLLYAWRAEYLLGLREDCMALVWFRSRSRFIEKIYSKLARLRPDKIRLSPVHLVKGTLNANISTIRNDRIIEKSFGSKTRTLANLNSVVGGYGPTWLNSSGLLNCVFTLSDEDSPDKYVSQASNLLKHQGLDNGDFYFCFSGEKKDTGLQDAIVGESDRFCIFPKSSLLDLVASIEHGIAISEKKWRRDK